MSKENKVNKFSEKSEIFFIYESHYSQPNGDPFTGEQRYDEETKKALVSDVRIKRFIRDYLEEKGYPILVSEKITGNKNTMKGILKALAEKYKDNKDLKTGDKIDVEKLMQQHIDVKLFGGVSTLEKADEKKLAKVHTQITGPVQFALLNPTLNKIDLRPHQNTSVLLSSEKNTQGAIATSSNVPYALVMIRGWVNPISAKYSGMQAEDLQIMFRALWDSIDTINTRSKHGTPLLLMQVVYKEDKSKIYGLEKKIKIIANKKEEAIRGFDEITLDLNDFIDAIEKSNKVKEVRFHTAEIDTLQNLFTKEKEKTDENKDKGLSVKVITVDMKVENANKNKKTEMKEKFKPFVFPAYKKEEQK